MLSKRIPFAAKIKKISMSNEKKKNKHKHKRLHVLQKQPQVKASKDKSADARYQDAVRVLTDNITTRHVTMNGMKAHVEESLSAFVASFGALQRSYLEHEVVQFYLDKVMRSSSKQNNQTTDVEADVDGESATQSELNVMAKELAESKASHKRYKKKADAHIKVMAQEISDQRLVHDEKFQALQLKYEAMERAYSRSEFRFKAAHSSMQQRMTKSAKTNLNKHMLISEFDSEESVTSQESACTEAGGRKWEQSDEETEMDEASVWRQMRRVGVGQRISALKHDERRRLNGACNDHRSR